MRDECGWVQMAVPGPAGGDVRDPRVLRDGDPLRLPLLRHHPQHVHGRLPRPRRRQSPKPLP